MTQTLQQYHDTALANIQHLVATLPVMTQDALADFLTEIRLRIKELKALTAFAPIDRFGEVILAAVTSEVATDDTMESHRAANRIFVQILKMIHGLEEYIFIYATEGDEAPGYELELLSGAVPLHEATH